MLEVAYGQILGVNTQVSQQTTQPLEHAVHQELGLSALQQGLVFFLVDNVLLSDQVLDCGLLVFADGLSQLHLLVPEDLVQDQAHFCIESCVMGLGLLQGPPVPIRPLLVLRQTLARQKVSHKG